VLPSITRRAAYLDNLGHCPWMGRLWRGRSLAAKRPVEKDLGPDHRGLAPALGNLGLLFRNDGKYKEAEQLFSRALEIRRKAFGKDHPQVAISLNNLAELFQAEGRYSEARFCTRNL
jgi:tetratricopeptide (TPR) repeat protein